MKYSVEVTDFNNYEIESGNLSFCFSESILHLNRRLKLYTNLFKSIYLYVEYVSSTNEEINKYQDLILKDLSDKVILQYSEGWGVHYFPSLGKKSRLIKGVQIRYRIMFDRFLLEIIEDEQKNLKYNNMWEEVYWSLNQLELYDYYNCKFEELPDEIEFAVEDFISKYL